MSILQIWVTWASKITLKNLQLFSIKAAPLWHHMQPLYGCGRPVISAVCVRLTRIYRYIVQSSTVTSTSSTVTSTSSTVTSTSSTVTSTSSHRHRHIDIVTSTSSHRHRHIDIVTSTSSHSATSRATVKRGYIFPTLPATLPCITRQWMFSAEGTQNKLFTNWSPRRLVMTPTLPLGE